MAKALLEYDQLDALEEIVFKFFIKRPCQIRIRFSLLILYLLMTKIIYLFAQKIDLPSVLFAGDFSAEVFENKGFGSSN